VLTYQVAPRAGAWIETSDLIEKLKDKRSPLAQGRGLKHNLACLLVPFLDVAPRAGAWIETYLEDNALLLVLRRPSRRGVD